MGCQQIFGQIRSKTGYDALTGDAGMATAIAASASLLSLAALNGKSQAHP
jgi:hypothetical protein